MIIKCYNYIYALFDSIILFFFQLYDYVIIFYREIIIAPPLFCLMFI